MQTGRHQHRPSLFAFYHFLHPDEVISSVLFSQLCSDLVNRGWKVSAFPSNRYSHEAADVLPLRNSWKGVFFRRIWRPALPQASSAGRILNAFWMILCWSFLAFAETDSPDVILMGTDPIFSVLIAPVWRWCHPSTRIAHWSFDLYPEAIYADREITRLGIAGRLLAWCMRKSYQACDLVADLGPCMRGLLRNYDPAMNHITLVPWALSEPTHPLPTDPHERNSLFGKAELALLYSGSFGRAHSSDDMLALMRNLQDEPVLFAFSVTGKRAGHLRQQVQPGDTNIRFVPIAPAANLDARLSSADIHVLSLRESWVGAVVPSKFFGALAAGRPILFCGPRNCSVAQWIVEFDLGWVMEPGQSGRIADEMRSVLHTPEALSAMSERCHTVYQEHFSRRVTVAAWDTELRRLLPYAAPYPSSER